MLNYLCPKLLYYILLYYTDAVILELFIKIYTIYLSILSGKKNNNLKLFLIFILYNIMGPRINNRAFDNSALMYMIKHVLNLLEPLWRCPKNRSFALN